MPLLRDFPEALTGSSGRLLDDFFAWVNVTFAGPGTYEWGMPVIWSLETLRPESPDRAAQGLRRRVVSATVRTLATGAFSAGEPGGIPDEVEGDASAEAAHDDAWRQRVRSTYGSDPQIRYFDTPLVVDNALGQVIE